jgi:hypothetical protein
MTPKPPKGEAKVKMTVYVTEETLHKVRVAAAERREKLSGLVERLLREWLRSGKGKGGKA